MPVCRGVTVNAYDGVELSRKFVQPPSRRSDASEQAMIFIVFGSIAFRLRHDTGHAAYI
jgi:hypothetical protein